MANREKRVEKLEQGNDSLDGIRLIRPNAWWYGDTNCKYYLTKEPISGGMGDLYRDFEIERNGDMAHEPYYPNEAEKAKLKVLYKNNIKEIQWEAN